MECNPEEFTNHGPGTMADYEGPAKLPMVFDAEGNDLLDHPIMRALRSSLGGGA